MTLSTNLVECPYCKHLIWVWIDAQELYKIGIGKDPHFTRLEEERIVRECPS